MVFGGILVTIWIIIYTLSAALLSAALTGRVRALAVRHGVMDLPNARSSHSAPTPRGGGVAIVLCVTFGLVTLVLLGRLDADLFFALSGGGLAVAAIGFLDDRRPLSARTRLVVHTLAAVWALLWLGGLPPIRLGGQLIAFGWAGYPLGALAIIWVLNLFNFMDGIDGIAASEALFIALGGALLSGALGLPGGLVLTLALFGAACLGFLTWNWPPARIFMGDVGSGYLGYFIAVIALVSGRYNSVGLPVYLILGGLFFADATVTFLRRLVRRDPVHLPHRSHAYQWLARRWHSHQRVTVTVALVNVLALLPAAYAAIVFPAFAGWILALALAVLVLAAGIAGAGRKENQV